MQLKSGLQAPCRCSWPALQQHLPFVAGNRSRAAAEVYFICAAAVCLVCLVGYVAILPRLIPGLAQKRQAALLKPKGSGMEVQVPLAQPIAGYHAVNDQAEARGSLKVFMQQDAEQCSCAADWKRHAGLGMAPGCHRRCLQRQLSSAGASLAGRVCLTGQACCQPCLAAPPAAL